MRRVELLAGLTLVIATTAGTALATDAQKPVLHENQNASAERLARTTEFFIVAKGKPRTTPAN